MRKSRRSDLDGPTPTRLLIGIALTGVGLMIAAAAITAIVLAIGWEGLSTLLFLACVFLGIESHSNRSDERARLKLEQIYGRCPVCQGTGLKGHSESHR